MASNVIDEWTEEKCLQLIREYRARPILWDQKDPFFFKKTLKPSAWREIADTLNIPANQCKHKMIILMSSFRREKSKIMHSMKKRDASQVYKSTWFAFKEMAFLLDKASERKRQLKDSDEVNEEEDFRSGVSIKSVLLSHHMDSPGPPAKKSRPNISANKEVQRKSNSEPWEAHLPPLQQRPGPSRQRGISPDRAEEIQSFVTFIHNKMKTYSDRTKNSVQQAICEIIFRADRDRYNSNKDDDNDEEIDVLNEDYTIIDNEPESENPNTNDDKPVIKIQNDTDTESDSD